MAMTEELKVIISAEIADMKAKVETARKEISNFGKKVKSYSKDIDADFKAIGDSINTGLKTASVAVAGAAAGLLALGASTAEYRTQQAQLTAAFETAGSSAETAKTVYNDLYRVLGQTDTATEAAQQLAQITTNEKELSEYTNICQGVFAMWGASIEQAGFAEGINHTIELGEVQGTLADALEWSGVSVESFNEKLAACATEEEREKLIRETLNGLYSESAANYEINAAALIAQNEAQAALTDNMAVLGEALQPVLTALTSLAADCLAVILPYVQSFADNYIPVIVSLLGEVAGVLQTALEWITQHRDILIIVAAVIGTVVAAIGLYNAVAAIKAAMDAAQVATLGGLIAAQLAHAAAAIAAIAPYVLIVAAIAAVIAIIVLCVKNWDEISAKVKEVAKAIWEKVKEMAEKVGEWFGKMREKIANTKLGEFVLNIFTSISDNIKAKIELAKTIVSNVVSAIKGIFTGDFTAVKTSLANITTAIVSNFRTKFDSARSTVLGIFDKIKTGLTDKISAARDKVGEIIDKIRNFMDFDWSLPKLKMPKFSVEGKFSLNPLSVPKFAISWNAMGGLFDKPTIFGYGDSLQGIGENGAEALIPLERNTRALDLIAGKMVERMGLNTPVVLSVDGKVLAQTTISSINEMTRQTGHLALNLA